MQRFMRLAIVHDWLKELGGAERVLIELHAMYPNAPIYTLFYDTKFAKKHLFNARIHASFLQRIPFIAKIYPTLVWLMPIAVESFDLSQFETVLSSSVTFSKGLVLKPSARHICYCYSPTRFLWDRHTEYGGGLGTRLIQHVLRLWDHSSAARVDQFIAISETVRNRIKKYYQKDSRIIYPPVRFDAMPDTRDEIQDTSFYLIVSRLYKHKNVELAIKVFNKLKYPLVIIGIGPEQKRLSGLANQRISFLGHLSDQETAWYYQNCRAFIMPQEEDFGITPIEAMGFGKPVIALRKGGATETIIEGVTGEFFDDPIPEALADAIIRFQQKTYDQKRIKAHASQFSPDRFRLEIDNLLNS